MITSTMKTILLFLSLACAAIAQQVIDWGDIDKTGSSLANLATRNAGDLNSGTLPVARLPALTGGDATSSAGSGALTLATVNSNTGLFGGATQALNITVDAKGRITAINQTVATPAWTSVTGKPTAVDGSTTQTANTLYAGPASGSAAAPAFRGLVQADTQAAGSPNRNALAPRGGVMFDGTTGSKLLATLGTPGAFGVDPASVVIGFKCPVTSGPGLLTISASNGGYSGSGTLVFMINGSSLLIQMGPDSDRNYATLANFTTTYGGKEVMLAFVRNASGNPTIYINAVAQTGFTFLTQGTPPTWQASMSATYLIMGMGFNSAEMKDPLRFVTLYNLALSAADVQEIYELGGAVPYRFQFGSQADLITGDSQTFAAGVGSWAIAGGAGDSISAVSGELQWTKGGTSIGVALSGSSTWSIAAGKAFRLRVTHRLISGTGTSIAFDFAGSGGGWGASFTPTSTPTTFDAVVVQPPNRSGSFEFYTGAGTGPVYGFDDIRVQRVGAVAHYQMDDGLGFQILDSSTNGLHATATTTGVAHLIAKTRGVVRFTTSTNGNQQILGQQALPPKARITSWTINSSGTPSVSLGNVSGGAQFLSAAALVSGFNDVTLLTRFSSTNNLWVSSNSTATLQHTISYEIVD